MDIAKRPVEFALNQRVQGLSARRAAEAGCQRVTFRHLLLMASGVRFEPERFSSLGDDSLTHAFDTCAT